MSRPAYFASSAQSQFSVKGEHETMKMIVGLGKHWAPI
ncbi:hypothetical protein N624_1059 [Levilactobacillus brevis]|nr:hypothetical protein N624_1059 [Levilactobacillus brevis]